MASNYYDSAYSFCLEEMKRTNDAQAAIAKTLNIFGQFVDDKNHLREFLYENISFTAEDLISVVCSEEIRKHDWWNIFNEKNKPLVNAVISLKIPSDVKRQISETEKEFDMMVTQLKQKRSKYNFSRTGNNLYNKYYELYKDNNKEVKYLNLNRIKYYQEAENDNKENEPQMNNNETLNNNQRMVDNTFNIYNTIYVNNKTNFGIGLTDTNLNNKVMNSFYGEKNRATRDNNNFSSRIRTNSSSSLVCPSNIIKNKLNSEF